MIKSLIFNLQFLIYVYSINHILTPFENTFFLINDKDSETTVNLVKNKNNFNNIFIQLMYCSSFKGKSHLDIYDNITKVFSTDIIGSRKLIFPIPNPKSSKLSFKIKSPYLYLQYQYTNERNIEYPSFITKNYTFNIKNHTIHYLIKPFLNNKPVSYQIFIGEGVEINDGCKQYEFSLGNNYYDKKNFPHIIKSTNDNISLEFNFRLKKFKQNQSNFTIMLKAIEEGYFNSIDFYYMHFEKVDWEKDVLGRIFNSNILYFLIIISALLFIGFIFLGLHYFKNNKKEEKDEYLSEEESKLVENYS